MSIPGMNGASRTEGTALQTPASMPDRQDRVTTEGGGNVRTQPSTPLRFPWLSRLSQELAPVAPQKPTFPAAPVLGDNVDRAV